jgi:hypothetical protein
MTMRYAARSIEIVCCSEGRELERVPLLLHLLSEHRGDIPAELYDPVKAAVDGCLASVLSILGDEK